MKSDILLIGENHSGGYNFKKIVKERNFKPNLLLVEGPFEKNDNVENILLDFKINCKIEYPSQLFPLISEEDKAKYIKNRNIPKNIEMKGLWDPEKRIFLESINELCLEYYKLGNMESEDSLLSGDTAFKFRKMQVLLKPLSSYLKKLKEIVYIKEEKEYLNWQIGQIERILNEIDCNKYDENKIDELVFINSIRKLEQFEKQRETLTFRTNNFSFLNTIRENLSLKDIAVIVGSKHVKYLSKMLKKNGHVIYEEIVG
jgi:hypothetical protein